MTACSSKTGLWLLTHSSALYQMVVTVSILGIPVLSVARSPKNKLHCTDKLHHHILPINVTIRGGTIKDFIAD